MKKVTDVIKEAKERVSLNHGIITPDVSWEDVAYELAYTIIQNEKIANEVKSPKEADICHSVSDSALCECKKEWLTERYEYNTYPYGATVVTLKCDKCEKVHSTRVL